MTKTNTHIAYLMGAGLAIYSQQAALALFLGIGLALTVGPPPLSDASRLSRGALQCGVVILGLALPFREVVTLGSANGAVVSVMVLATLISGLALLKLLRTDDVSGKLLTTGTAVCGGTAVATLAPVIKAENQQVAQTLTIIFILNGIAIILFPAIGHALDLSQQQFGMWAAVAIHDTSSVVGAAAAYGDEALTTAATLKILRILWLIPVIIVASYSMKRISANEIRIPLFVAGFIIASVIGGYFQFDGEVTSLFSLISKSLFGLALFLIGSQMSLKSLKSICPRLIGMALVLWSALSLGSLYWVTTV
ncbi:MAG TPA: putative sulfate exporter family transporter [Halieaceae bacterium]|nr:putative sulfate exporter family transporter [Halieaceae bacterium]